MSPSESADIIDSICSSLKCDPEQFNLAINVYGQHVISHGGIGLNVSATGGGPGSSTIGNQVSLTGSHIEIAREKGGQVFEQRLKDLLKELNQISEQLRSPSPDNSVILRIIASLKNTWVPGVIVSVVGNVVSKALGI